MRQLMFRNIINFRLPRGITHHILFHILHMPRSLMTSTRDIERCKTCSPRRR